MLVNTESLKYILCEVGEIHLCSPSLHIGPVAVRALDPIKADRFYTDD